MKKMQCSCHGTVTPDGQNLHKSKLQILLVRGGHIQVGDPMKVRKPIFAAAASIALLTAGVANAALLDGTDGSSNTSVFISVVERNATNQILRNLLIDTGARTLAAFEGTGDWSTTTAQASAIAAFLGSATGTVAYNIGGGLTDGSFVTDLQGFLTSGNATGPDESDYTAVTTAITNVTAFINNANQGTFSADGVLAANAAIDPGWHGNQWGNDFGGAILPSNEIAFGQVSQIVGWKTRPGDFAIIRSVLGTLESDSSGNISFTATAVPLPAAAWFLPPVLGMLVPWMKRRRADG
jgi:hypothetical protein